MTLPHPIILAAIYLVLLAMCLMWISREINKPDYPYDVENYDSSKYISVKADNARRSLCSKSNYLMKLYDLRQDEIFAGMEPGIDTSSTVKRIDNQIKKILDLMDRDREILKDEGVFELAEQNCQYR